jgi:hypothetical protein
MHKSATKCNETLGKWCKNKHGASKIIDTFETYHLPTRRSMSTTTAGVASTSRRDRDGHGRAGQVPRDIGARSPSMSIKDLDDETSVGVGSRPACTGHRLHQRIGHPGSAPHQRNPWPCGPRSGPHRCPSAPRIACVPVLASLPVAPR